MQWKRLLAVGVGVSLVGALLVQAGHSHSESISPRLGPSCWVCTPAGLLTLGLPTAPVVGTPEVTTAALEELPFTVEVRFWHTTICVRAPPGVDARA